AYTNALKFFSRWPVDIHVVYVNLPTEKFKSSAVIYKERDLFFKVDHRMEIPANVTSHVVCDYSIEGGLFQYAEAVGADIIAMPTHGRKGLAHFFKGSIGEDVANRAEIPVLTIQV
ncbi:MAG: universal stress protein, partial [Eudoraea sp.]|nr:universal stress protein [Eudoraea sp.]